MARVIHTVTPVLLFVRDVQTYYVSQQYRRAIMLLTNHGLMEDVRFRYLAAMCLAECKDWDECLTLLGDGELDDQAAMDVSMSACCLTAYKRVAARAAILAGQVWVHHVTKIR